MPEAKGWRVHRHSWWRIPRSMTNTNTRPQGYPAAAVIGRLRRAGLFHGGSAHARRSRSWMLAGRRSVVRTFDPGEWSDRSFSTRPKAPGRHPSRGMAVARAAKNIQRQGTLGHGFTLDPGWKNASGARPRVSDWHLRRFCRNWAARRIKVRVTAHLSAGGRNTGVARSATELFEDLGAVPGRVVTTCDNISARGPRMCREISSGCMTRKAKVRRLLHLAALETADEADEGLGKKHGITARSPWSRFMVCGFGAA